MNLSRQLKARFAALFRKRELDTEMAEEMRSHIELRTQENVAAGMNPEEARYAALRQFGRTESLQEQCRDQRGVSGLENLMRDFRFGVRQLRRNPGFTTVAVFTLALAIGANLTIFALIDGILLRPLPFPGGDRLVTTIQSFPLSGVERSRASLANYYDYRTHIKSFASVAMIHTDYSGPTIVGGTDTPFRVECDRVSPEFFSTLQVPLRMGRSFSEDEMTYGGSHVAVLTDEFWRSYFNADPQVLGRTFPVDGVTTTVIGLLPPGFHFLSRRAQFYTPGASDPAERAPGERHNNRCVVIARLAPGATLSDARAEIAALDAVQIPEDPNAALLRSSGFRTIVDPLHADHVRTIRPTLLLLEGGVLILLLVAGVNLVNLLLIRASSRAKELAIRQSLGAGRWSVLRQALTETVVLALLGGAFGLVLAAGGIRLVGILGTDQLPLGSYITFDGRLALAAFLGAIA
ncbi:MAG TPA: ABC transporter permease, partial [Candidatus Limnocylindria bacterium]|nr:ABC transporter permease [Candidatus Limnocylindria bacterium]